MAVIFLLSASIIQKLPHGSTLPREGEAGNLIEILFDFDISEGVLGEEVCGDLALVVSDFHGEESAGLEVVTYFGGKLFD